MIPIINRVQYARNFPACFSRIIFAGFDVAQLLNKTALVCGAGGLGVVVAEILARTGVRNIIIVDKDIVESENFNRLGFTSEDVGRPKAEALSKKLEKIRNVPNIPEEFHLKTKNYEENVIAWDELEDLVEACDAIFACFDNPSARLELNYFAVEKKKPLFDGGTSENGLRGSVTTVIPGVTPCLRCYYSPKTYVEIDEGERLPGECGASLATTMSIVASLQADQGIKHLLGETGIVPRIRISLEEEAIMVIERGQRRPNCDDCSII